MTDEYVSLASHRGELYALTKDGRVYRVVLNDLTGSIVYAQLLYRLPQGATF